MSKVNIQRINYPGRRNQPTPIISKYTFFGGQRKNIRRKSDKRHHIFVDLYSTRLLIILLAILFFCYLDAFLTLSLISEGLITEANPVLAFHLEQSTLNFIINKFLLTTISITILCLFKNVFIARVGLPLTLMIYISVIAYQLYLVYIH